MSREFIGYGVAGAPGPYDKGLVMFDDLEASDLWVAAGNAGDYAAARSTLAVFRGAYGLKLDTRVTNPADGDWVSAVRVIPFPYRDKLWFRCRWRPWVQAVISNVEFRLDVYNGAKQRRAALRYVPATPAFQYLNGLGGWSDLAALAITLANSAWTQLDWCVDLTLNQYVGAYLNGKYADLRTIGYYEVAVEAIRKIEVKVLVTNVGANSARADFDDIYIGEHVII